MDNKQIVDNQGKVDKKLLRQLKKELKKGEKNLDMPYKIALGATIAGASIMGAGLLTYIPMGVLTIVDKYQPQLKTEQTIDKLGLAGNIILGAGTGVFAISAVAGTIYVSKKRLEILDEIQNDLQNISDNLDNTSKALDQAKKRMEETLESLDACKVEEQNNTTKEKENL